MIRRNIATFLSAVLILALAGCNPATAPTADASSGAGTGSVSQPGAPSRMSGSTPNRLVSIDEIGLGPDGYVSLTNFTDVPVTLEGTYLCQGNSCFALPGAVIEAGQVGLVALGTGAGLNNVVATNATVGELRPSDGEIALFASATVSADQILNYLEWGSTPHALTKLAIEAGLRLEGSYAPTSDTATRLYRIPESGLWVFDAP